MPEYTKMKNSELEALLKERKLPHQGRKDEKVARLLEADKATSAAPGSEHTQTEPTSKPTIQSAGISTEDQPTEETLIAKDDDVTKQTEHTDAAVVEEASETNQPTEAVKPAANFSAHLASTSLDEEIEKRKKRANKFGMSDQESDAIKNLERQKKFGTGPTSAQKDDDNVSRGVTRLDEALPERQRGAKRSHEGTTADTYEDTGLKRRRGGGLRGRGRGRGRQGPPRSNDRGGNGRSWMSDADKAAADKRKAKFSG